MSGEPGWYEDPRGTHALRYWDGSRWTEHTHDEPVAVPADETIHRDPVELPTPVVPRDQPASAGDDRRATSGWVWVVAALAVAVVGIWAFVGFQTGSGDDEDQTAVGSSAGSVDASDAAVATPQVTPEVTVAPPAPPASATPFPTATPTQTPVPTTTPVPTATTAPVTERTATLLVNVAKLRDRPQLDAREVDSIDDQAGARITVIGEPIDGWYRVRVAGSEGWMFGGFIVPAADGLTVLQTRSEQRVTLVDATGRETSIFNESGSYALATARIDDTLWQVILPDGSTAYVRVDDMRVRS